MYFLYCDESNLEPRRDDFFVYGGLAVPAINSAELSQKVADIRSAFDIADDFLLKFNPGPKHLSHFQFIEVKQAVIEAAIETGCSLITSFISHNVATNERAARINEINRVTYHFNCYLVQQAAHGLVLVDRFDDAHIDAHLREKFSSGLKGLPYSHTMSLDRILGFHYSAIGQAHFPSVVDIVLGSLRFSINALTRGETKKMSSAEKILRLIAPLYSRSAGRHVPETGLCFSPKAIRNASFREQYTRLKEFLAENDIPTQQVITAERNY